MIAHARSLPSLIVVLVALVSWPVPAGAQDQTALIQLLLDRGGAVKIPPGVHTVGPLKVPPKVTSISGPATLKLKNNAGAWARVLLVKRSTGTDSSISISNLTVDMNRNAQGWQGKHDLEHQAAIFLEADKMKSGKLNAKIRNVNVKNSAGDGIYVYHGVRLDLDNYQATDVFRGALGITGKQSVVTARHCRLVRAGLDVEPNSDGDNVDVTLDDFNCTKFEVALFRNGKFKGNRVTVVGNPYLYCHPRAEFVCQNSSFTGRYKIRLPGQSTFVRCQFTGPPRNVSPVISVQWAHKSLTSGMTLKFADCVINGPGSIGIDTGIDSPRNGNRLLLSGVKFVGTQGAIVAQKGQAGVWQIVRTTFNGLPIQ